MGKDWDKDKGGRDKWIIWMTEIATEACRVLKPGGHALVWSLPRTSHWTATAWENAGFEVRDRVSHLFGSGFPKSHNISKAIDKMARVERTKIIGTRHRNVKPFDDENGWNQNNTTGDFDYLAPATPEAQQWDGWGTALKPAMEDWWLLRKPCSEKTVAENVLKWGTGAINIDASRVESNRIDTRHGGGNHSKHILQLNPDAKGYNLPQGRWPANLIHDGSEEVLMGFPESKGQQGDVKGTEPSHTGESGIYGAFQRVSADPKRNDSGSAARFFYCAKPSKKERNDGLDGIEEKDIGHNRFDKCSICGGTILQNPDRPSACKCENPIRENNIVKGNFHPTVKPLSLMRYLITLITPPNGTVLDPFLGSGTTLVAAKELGFSGRGIENDPEYLEIAKRRIDNAKCT